MNLHSLNLTDILATPLKELQFFERALFTQLTVAYPDLVLHGAGNLGHKILNGLRSVGIEPIAFTDIDPAKWGKTVGGLKVIPPDEAAKRYANHASFVICIFSPGMGRDHTSITKSLKQLGAQNIVSFVPLFWKYPDLFLPHYRLDLPSKVIEAKAEVQAAYDLLIDDKSRTEYEIQVRWLLTPSFEHLWILPGIGDQYFPEDIFTLSTQEEFVDVGAFTGDTLGIFLQRSTAKFNKIHCYEPDPNNFAQLSACILDLPEEISNKIIIKNAAVGSERSTVRIDPVGEAWATVSNSGSYEVPCVALNEESLENPSYIKMDIEGFEPYALSGASDVISRWTPRLAVCVYHIQDHLWRLPLQIRSYNDNYAFYMRRYEDFQEVVLYAVPRI